MKITEFKKGDRITRIEPIEMVVSDGIGIGFGFGGTRTEKDYHLVGKEVIFIGVANGLVYYNLNGEFSSDLVGRYGEGWAKYVDPKTL